jgi:L-iditol 2-dehydrogenase
MKPSPGKPEIQRIVQEVLARLPQSGPSTESRPRMGRVAQLTAVEKLELKRFPLPSIAEDEILVKVEACGICGTDIHCYKGDPFKLTPVVLGHEGTGIVLEVGKAVKMDGVGKPVRPGDQIVTSILETSEECLIAKYNPRKANLCDDLKVYGLLRDEPDYHFNGYFGEYLVIRPGSSFFVVNDMSVDQRVLIEPAAVVCHALERAKTCGVNLNFRSRVVVQGCGAIGLLMIAVLRTSGVNNIIAVDGNPDRLKTAQTLGADVALNFRDFADADDLAAKVVGLTKGFGAHFGFQATGVPGAFGNLFKLIRRGGGICEVGHFVDGGSCEINPHRDFCHKEITVTGSWVYNSFEYPYAYHFIQRAEAIGLPLTSLITHRFPLERIEDAFESSMKQDGIKVVVEVA